MERLKDLAREVGLKLIVAGISGLILAIGGLFLALLRNDPQPTLLVVLVVLSVSNFVAILILYYRRRQSHQEGQQSSKDLADGIQDLDRRVTDLRELLEQSPLISRTNNRKGSGERLNHLFDLKNRPFDKESQKIVLRFRNDADSPFYIRKIVYYGDKLTESGIHYTRKDPESRLPMLDFDEETAHVKPGDYFTVDLRLKHRWKEDDYNAMVGDLGTVRIFADYIRKGKRQAGVLALGTSPD